MNELFVTLQVRNNGYIIADCQLNSQQRVVNNVSVLQQQNALRQFPTNVRTNNWTKCLETMHREFSDIAAPYVYALLWRREFCPFRGVI